MTPRISTKDGGEFSAQSESKTRPFVDGQGGNCSSGSILMQKRTKSMPLTHDVWVSISGNKLPRFELLPRHVSIYFATSIEHPTFVRDYANSLIMEWPLNLKRKSNEMDSSELLTCEATLFELQVLNSSVKHRHAGRGAFAATVITPGDIICYVYETLIYKDLDIVNEDPDLCDDIGIMGMSVKRFRDYAVQVRTYRPVFDDVTNYRHGDRSFFVVPPLFCVGAYINSSLYHEDDEENEKYANHVEGGTHLLFMRKPNAYLIQKNRPCTNQHNLVEPEFISVIALENINVGQETFLDYRSDEAILVKE